MKLGKLIDIVKSLFLQNILHDLKELVLNPGHFQFTKVPQLIKKQLCNYDEFVIFYFFRRCALQR